MPTTRLFRRPAAVVPVRARGGAASAAAAYRNPVEALEPRQFLTVVSGFTETLIAGGLTRATKVTVAPDGRLFVSLQDGQVRVVKNGQLLSQPFVTVSTLTERERGVQGVAFDPNFATNKYVYVYYATPDGDRDHNRVSRFTADGDVAVPGSEKVIFEMDHFADSGLHNGGAMEFGKDGKLYVSVGENNYAQDAQQFTNTRGKVLRINSDGSIPTDNPFYDRATGKAKAMWAMGLRNPFSMDVQPGTGRLVIGDVGGAKFEEINDGRAGANYGWPTTEGPTTDSRFQTPFYAYDHSAAAGKGAIVGVSFYNPTNPTFPSSYVGDVFFGDYAAGYIKRIDLGTKQVSNFASNLNQVTDITVTADGSLYYLTRGDGGRLFRVRPSVSSAPTISVQPDDETVAVGQTATFSVTAGGSGLGYQWQRNGTNIAGATSATYTRTNVQLADDGATFRCVVTNSAGSATTRAALLTVIDDKAPTATIVTPDGSGLWAGGQTISFSGTGTDPEDGTLPGGAFTWRVDFHHDTHFHPFVAPTTGSTSGSFTIPRTGETDPDVWYRIHLTVTDSRGLTHSTSRDIFPQKVDLSLASEPAGLSLELDDQPTATPHATPAVVGLTRTLGAPATAVKDGVTYEFVEWSDGGAREHDVTTPSSDVTYTARYRVSTQQAVTLAADADAYVRDGSHAGTNFGTAADLQLKNAPTAGWTRHTYLKFDLSQLGDGDVSSATLRLHARLDNTQSASVPVSVFAGPDNWTESGLTWGNKPASGATVLKSFTVRGTTAQYYEVDLTSYLQQKKAAGATVASVVLKAGATSNSTVVITSDEAASNEPQLVVLAAAGPTPTPGTPLRAQADALVRDGTYGGTNYGTDPALVVKRGSQAGYTRESYLRFDLGSLASVSAGKLRLFGHLSVASSIQVAVYNATNTTWPETGITFNTRPVSGAAALATKSVAGMTDQWHEWDLTGFLQGELAAGRKVVTLVLKSLTTSDAAALFASDEAAANRPELLVTA
jgi:glucose/arabinose dehydrogenase